MRRSALIVASLLWKLTFAQDIVRDTVLQPVVIEAYSYGRPISEVSAAIGTFSQQQLNRFNNTSLLSAANTVPGVRMEERSPGSYRFSIRGSLLRSPFGIRNVKVYWNRLPFTDAGGNTYLNLLDNSAIGRAEIIKGAAGSLYGANTGGVVLLNQDKISADHLQFESLAGSYGFFRNSVLGGFQAKYMRLNGGITQQTAAGYRNQSSFKRTSLHTNTAFALSDRSTLTATFLITDLFYETPGALTVEEFNNDPRQARPAAGPNRGAEEQKASVHNVTPFLGLEYEHDWNQQWTTRAAIVGSHTDFKNFAIRNYEHRKETNVGLRNENSRVFEGKTTSGQFIVGAETQFMQSPIEVYGNTFGVRDTMQIHDDTDVWTGSVFSQIELDLPSGFFFTVGASLNFLQYNLHRTYPEDDGTLTKKFDPVFSPRIALLKKFSEQFSIYANVSRGFSPPSLAEVRPSTSVFNTDLQPEKGLNYELGLRGTLFKKISFDVDAYDLRLNETITIRHDEAGVEYFVNAGRTDQIGFEGHLAFEPVKQGGGLVSDVKFFISYSYNHYQFKDYQSDSTDLSGKALAGVPPVVCVAGLDASLRKRFSFYSTLTYNDHVPLTNDNSVYAPEFFLLNIKASYKAPIGKHVLETFAGADNLLDARYSLGHDLNAAGSRFYNAAPGRNYFAGIIFRLNFE